MTYGIPVFLIFLECLNNNFYINQKTPDFLKIFHFHPLVGNVLSKEKILIGKSRLLLKRLTQVQTERFQRADKHYRR